MAKSTIFRIFVLTKEKKYMVVIDVPAKSFGTRKVFTQVDPKFLEFTPGVRILHASMSESNPLRLTFLKKHEAGEKFFPDGGFTCRDSSGANRSFYLDEVIIHPEVFRKTEDKPKRRTRATTTKTAATRTRKKA